MNKDKGGLCARPSSVMIFQKVVKEERGESHHLKRGDVDMEAIMNLCASRRVVHEDQVRRP